MLCTALRRLVRLAVVVGCLVWPAAACSNPGEVRVTLFHATHFDGAFVGADGRDFAQHVALLNRLRAALPDPENSLYLGNGDDIDPGMTQRVLKDNQVTMIQGGDVGGMHAIEAFNSAGLDAETYGFNELDWIDRLAPQLPKARFTVVSANVRDRATGEVYGSRHGARPWVIKTVAGVRFGITGVITGEGRSRVFGADVIDPARGLAQVVPQMREAGAQIVVVLSHLDTRTEAQRLARAVAGIDLILGSHVGDPLTQPERIGGTVLSVPEWLVGNFGSLELTIRDGRIAAIGFRQHTVLPDGPRDPEIKAILGRYLPRP